MSKRALNGSVDLCDVKKSRVEWVGKRLVDDRSSDSRSKRRKFAEYLESIPSLPSGWARFISKFIEPPTQSAIVVYRSPEEIRYRHNPS